MTIEIEIRHTLVFSVLPDGRHHCALFADMPDAAARRLAHEYGIDERHIYAIGHESFRRRRQIDGEAVWEILSRQPYLETHTPEQLLNAVRCLVPQAVRVIKLHDRPTA